jgi:AraC-like DNA-binding protein
MEVNWNTWTILFLLISGHGFLISGLIAKLKPRYRYFALATLLFSVLLLYYLCFWTGVMQSLPRWTGILMGIPYLMAALVYRQVRPAKLWRHMIVYLFFVSFILLSLLIDFNQGFYTAQAAFQCGFLIIYSVLTIRAARTNIDRLLGWLFLGFSLAHLSYYILSWTQLLTPEQDYFVSLAGAAFMYGGAWFVLFGKTKKLDDIDLNQKMRNMLIERIEEHKLYLDNELRLQSLSETTGFSVHQISELINSGGKNFTDLINGYRVREAQRLLESLEYEHLSTTEIGYQAGFNNKTSFYKHFKRLTGESPMQYRNRRKVTELHRNQ